MSSGVATSSKLALEIQGRVYYRNAKELYSILTAISKEAITGSVRTLDVSSLEVYAMSYAMRKDIDWSKVNSISIDSAATKMISIESSKCTRVKVTEDAKITTFNSKNVDYENVPVFLADNLLSPATFALMPERDGVIDHLFELLGIINAGCLEINGRIGKFKFKKTIGQKTIERILTRINGLKASDYKFKESFHHQPVLYSKKLVSIVNKVETFTNPWKIPERIFCGTITERMSYLRGFVGVSICKQTDKSLAFYTADEESRDQIYELMLSINMNASVFDDRTRWKFVLGLNVARWFLQKAGISNHGRVAGYRIKSTCKSKALHKKISCRREVEHKLPVFMLNSESNNYIVNGVAMATEG